MDKVSPTGKPLAGTTLLEMEGDLADQMVEGINRFLQRQLKASIDRRARHWKRDFSSHANYVQSIEKIASTSRRSLVLQINARRSSSKL